MGKFEVTGIEEEEEQEIFNGKETIKEDGENGLKEVVVKKILQMLEQSFQESTIQHSVTVETSGDSDIQSSVDLAKNEIQTIEVVCDRVYHKKKRTFYIQLEKGETETEIAMADTENEDRIEVPVDDVEHGQEGTDSKTSGRK